MSITRRAAVLTGPGQVTLREYPLEELAPPDAWIKVQMCGVCGTDVHVWNAEDPAPWSYPFVPGHEPVGVLARAGRDFPSVDEYGAPIKEGDRIVVQSYPCGRCYACRTLMMPFLCMGQAPWADRKPDMVGGFGDYIFAPGEAHYFRVPDNVPSSEAVLTEPFAIAISTVQRAMMPELQGKGGTLGPGTTVAVQGAGPIGILSAIAAKLAGATQVIVIGAPQARLDLCKDLGADTVINIEEIPDPQERLELVRDLTPHRMGPDAVIEAAGAPAAFVEGVEMVRRGGTLVEVGHFTDHGTVTVNPHLLCHKHINLLGMWVGPPANFGVALKMLSRHRDTIDFGRIVTHRFPLDQVEDAVAVARKHECMKAVIAFER
jgi:L-iditol 2-dehydrogenase